MVVHSWRGQWIGRADAVGVAMPPVLGHQALLFRRTVALDEGRAGRVLVSADARYTLWVNGHEVGRGPVRNQPRRWSYDEWDLAEVLRPGANEVVALVSWYGDANAFWFPAVREPGLGGRPTLVADLELDGCVIGTDESWQVALATAWSQPPRAFYDGIPVEARDDRLLPPDWQAGSAGELDWTPAIALRAEHLGGLARTRPPANPYGQLSPRPVGALSGERVSGRPSRCWMLAADPLGDRPCDDVVRALGRPLSPTGPGPWQVEGGQAVLVEVDLGRVLGGLVEFEVEAPVGTVVDVLHRERRVLPGPGAGAGPPTASRLVTRGGCTIFRAQELAGLRHAYLLLRPPDGGRLDLGSFAVAEQVQQWQGGASFSSSVDGLESLWRAGLRTAQVCSLDAFVDCPSREQRAWVGDGVVTQMVHLATNADRRPAWRYVELADSPRSDGILPMAVAGETEANNGVTIPAWSLFWVAGVHQMWLHDPDHDRVAALLPDVARVLRWFARHQGPSGVLDDLPEWNMVDWSSVFLTGRSSIVSALWVRALRQYAAMTQAMGDGWQARWATARVAEVRAGFDQFWDAGRGCYVDHVLDGRQQLPASQLAQATAVLAGIVPSSRLARVREWMTGPGRLVDRTLLQTTVGQFDLARQLELLDGRQRIDWDPARQVVRAAPFGAHLVHEALGRIPGGEHELVASLQRWQGFLVDGYDTFGEQWGEDGSPAHGWSSCPTVDIVRRLVGVTPAEPGFGRARVAPVRLLLDSGFECTTPTPVGELWVSVADGQVSVDSPLEVDLVLPDRTTTLAPGRHRLVLGEAGEPIHNNLATDARGTPSAS